MRRVFHRYAPDCDYCDLYIFTGLDLYDFQDLYDLPEWNVCDLNDMYILSGRGLYDLQDLNDLQDFCMIWGICKSLIIHTCLSMISNNNRSSMISNRVTRAKQNKGSSKMSNLCQKEQ